jgi:hypothetical protein
VAASPGIATANTVYRPTSQRVPKIRCSPLASDAWDTLKGSGGVGLVEPLTDIAKTVRAGGEGGIIVQEGSIGADLQVWYSFTRRRDSLPDVALFFCSR